MMTTRHPLATAWLDRVAALTSDLPPATRAELLADLGDHLDEALAEVDDGSRVEEVLARLGDPADVAAAAREAGGPMPPTPPGVGPVVAVPAPTPASTPVTTPGPAGLTAVEGLVLAVVVLLGLLGLVVLWLVGVVVGGPLLLLVWAGALVTAALGGRWTGAEVVGLALLPIGWSVPVWATVVPVSVTQCTTDSAGVETCTGGGGSPWALAGLLVVLVLVGLATRHLARAPRGRPRRR